MSKKSINVKLIKTLNRGVLITAFPTGKPINFVILHHKISSALQFQVDLTNEIISSNKVAVKMYRNLEKSRFCNLFLKLNTVENDKYDYRSKFEGMSETGEQDTFRFFSEKLDLNAPDVSNKISNNYLLTLGWKLHGIEDDYLFFFVQRKCYNIQSKTTVVRTAGLEFITPKGEEVLNKYKLTEKVDVLKAYNSLKDLGKESFESKIDEAISKVK